MSHFTCDWYSELHEHVLQRYRLGNLPHALLIQGEEGIAKTEAITQLSKGLLCQNLRDNEACGECASCELFEAGSHPNLSRLTTEKNVEKKTESPIKIDQIRELSTKLVMTSHFSGPNIAIVEQAEKMNHFAANALLKTLEEPTDNTVIFLICSQPSQLLPTIRSRCQAYTLTQPTTEQSMSWLAAQCEELEVPGKLEDTMKQALLIANGAPLRALGFIEDNFIDQRSSLLELLSAFLANKCTVSQLVTEAKEIDFQSLINLLQSVLQDSSRWQHIEDKETLSNKDTLKFIKQISNTHSQALLYFLQDELCTLLKTHNASINTQLMLESFFSTWHNELVNQIKIA